MQARHPEVVVLDGRYSGYDRTLFFDEAHLDVEGGTALSTAIGRLVNARLADPSRVPEWSQVPDYQVSKPGKPLEDLWASRVISMSKAPKPRR